MARDSEAIAKVTRPAQKESAVSKIRKQELHKLEASAFHRSSSPVLLVLSLRGLSHLLCEFRFQGGKVEARVPRHRRIREGRHGELPHFLLDKHETPKLVL